MCVWLFYYSRFGDNQGEIKMKNIITLVTISLITFAANGAEPLQNDGISILKKRANGSILLGRAMLSESDRTDTQTDNDTFSMPNCYGQNQFISGIRLQAPRVKHNRFLNLDALIRSVTIVFGNGNSRQYTLNQVLRVTENSGDGINLRFENRRCVRSISVLGEQFEVGRDRKSAQVNVIGLR